MKSFVSLLSLLSALSLYAFDFTPYRTIVCFGDSITHGGFYPMYLQQYHAENDPGHPRRFINRGISGNTVKDLLDRADEMLKTDKPDLVLVMIGTNDLLFTTKFAEKNLPFEDAAKKYPVFQRFEKQLGSLLDLFKQRGVAVVLLATPPYNETSNPAVAAPLNANMDSSGVRNILVIEQRLAREKGAVWIDIHAPLLKNLQDHDSGTPRSKSRRGGKIPSGAGGDPGSVAEHAEDPGVLQNNRGKNRILRKLGCPAQRCASYLLEQTAPRSH